MGHFLKITYEECKEVCTCVMVCMPMHACVEVRGQHHMSSSPTSVNETEPLIEPGAHEIAIWLVNPHHPPDSIF